MDDVLKLVKENPYLEIFHDDSGKEKVKCKLTGHQLRCQLSDIISYTKGKKYQRLLKGLATLDKTEKDFSLEKYKQYLVPAEKRKNQLYCKVTKKLINDIPHHIELHVKGRRFQRALKKYEESKSDKTMHEGGDEINVWMPSEESSSEPEIDPLPDSFGEDSDDDEEEKKEEAVEVENDDDDEEEDKKKDKDKKKESNSNKTNKQSKNKIQGNKNNNAKTKLSNTKKRSLKEENSERKEIPKKIKKQSKSKAPFRQNLRRKAKK